MSSWENLKQKGQDQVADKKFQGFRLCENARAAHNQIPGLASTWHIDIPLLKQAIHHHVYYGLQMVGIQSSKNVSVITTISKLIATNRAAKLECLG